MTRWQSGGELKRNLNSLPETGRLFKLYGLPFFADTAFYSRDFQLTSQWLDYISPTENGRTYLTQIRKAGLAVEDAHAAFVLFRLLYHHDLFIDHISSDLDGIIALLNQMNQDGSAKWPYIYGAKLYNKFNEFGPPGRTDHLEPEEATELLRDTSQGVFQIGDIISGPLGFTRSLEMRFIPPTLNLLLWHCSDPGCQKGHFVRLRQFQTAIKKEKDAFVRHIIDTSGPPSEWDGAILNFYGREYRPNGHPYADLPQVVGDCILGSERRHLLLRCLHSSHNSMLRSCLMTAGKLSRDLGETVDHLTPEEQHQLILLMPDRELVQYIDELTANKQIRIPATEIRTKKTPWRRIYGHERSDLSSLGIRSCRHDPIIELASAIWSTYEKLGLRDELVWRLRGHEGFSAYHSLFDFIRVHGPEVATRLLVLSSNAVTRAIAEKKMFQIIDGEEEYETIKRFLWKFGFTISRYEETYSLLRNRVREFKDCVLQLGPELSEVDKEKVRAVGVNLFVSVESFLEDIITYNVWLLCSDHFVGRRFRFTMSDAHNAVVRTLGTSIRSGDKDLSWSTDGANDLGTLLAYLQVFRRWLKDSPQADKSALRRPRGDYPHFAEDTTMVFVFNHTALWADTEPEILTNYIKLIDRMHTLLAQARLSETRNGIDHKRPEEEFPSQDKMMACVSGLDGAVEFADENRLIPKLFWGIRSESDVHGNVCDTFADYRGVSVSLWAPSLATAREKSFGVPYIIAPVDFLGQPNSILVFNVATKSEYFDYWRDYPRRRFIPPKKELSSETYTEQGADDKPDLCTSKPIAEAEDE